MDAAGISFSPDKSCEGLNMDEPGFFGRKSIRQLMFRLVLALPLVSLFALSQSANAVTLLSVGSDLTQTDIVLQTGDPVELVFHTGDATPSAGADIEKIEFLRNGTVFDTAYRPTATPVFPDPFTSTYDVVEFPAGNYVVKASFYDEMDNLLDTTNEVTIKVAPPPPIPMMYTSPSPPMIEAGENVAVTFAGVVDDLYNGVDPTGKLYFYIEDEDGFFYELCHATVIPDTPYTSAPASCTSQANMSPLSLMAEGSRNLKLEYKDDSLYPDSIGSTSFQLEIFGTDTTTTLALSSPSPDLHVGIPVTLTTTIEPDEAGNHPLGGLDLKDDGALICFAPTSDNIDSLTGIRTTLCSHVFFSLGPHTLEAEYHGDANDSGSSHSIVTSSVAQYPTELSASSSHIDTGSGYQVNILATVKAFFDDIGSTAGTLSFPTFTGCSDLSIDSAQDGVQQIQPRPAPGLPSCTFTVPAPGPVSVTLTFTGSGLNENKTFNVAFTIPPPGATPATTTVLLDANPSSVILDGSVQLLAEVDGITPTGTIRFVDSGVTIPGCAARPLTTSPFTSNRSEATCTTSFATRGNHPLQAIYTGDANNDAAQSNTRTVSVSGLATTTGISVINAPAYVGQPFILGAKVSGGDGATGTVTFLNDGIALPGCTARPLSTTGPVRSTDCVTTFAATGNVTIQAQYSGDSRHSPSQGFVDIDVESASGMALSLLNLALVQQPVVVRATLVDLPLDGVVTFSQDGDVVSGCEDILPEPDAAQHGIADCELHFAEAGEYLVQADYNHAGGVESAELEISVNRIPSQTTLELEPIVQGLQVGDRAWLHVRVAPATVIGGVVELFDNAEPMPGCEAQELEADGDGSARISCEVWIDEAGEHVWEARYLGDSVHAPSSDALTVWVSGGADDLALTLMGSAQVGTTAHLRATAQDPDPDGLLSFDSGNMPLGQCQSLPLGPISPSGSASADCQVSFNHAGWHQFGAILQEWGNSQREATLSVFAARALTSIQLQQDARQANAGWRTHARVLGQAPSGHVDFYADGSPVANCQSVPLDYSSGSVPSALCQADVDVDEPDSVAARYSGDAANEAAYAVLHLNAALATQSQLVLSLEPSDSPQAGERVELVARIAGDAPTGSVQFRNGNVVLPDCAVVTLKTEDTADTDHAMARCNTAFTAAGDYLLVAAYNGDQNNLGSSDELMAHVDLAGTRVDLRLDSGSVYAGGEIELSVRVSGRQPSGTIRFEADGESISGCTDVVVETASPVHATAQCRTVLTQAGAHSLQAFYSGDATNLATASRVLSFASLDPPAITGIHAATYFGQAALRIVLENPEATEAQDVVVMLPADQVDQMLFIPVCEPTQDVGEGIGLRCESIEQAGIHCQASTTQHLCQIESMGNDRAYSFLVVPKAGRAEPPMAQLSVAGQTLGTVELRPDH